MKLGDDLVGLAAASARIGESGGSLRRSSARRWVASITDGDRPRMTRSPRRSRMNISSWVVLASEIAIRFCRTDRSSDRAEMKSVSAVSTPQGISEMHRKKNSSWVLIRVRGQRACRKRGRS